MEAESRRWGPRSRRRPPTYVFEGLRGVLLDHVLRADLMLTGLVIDSRLFAGPPAALRGCPPARDGREPYCKWGNSNRMSSTHADASLTERGLAGMFLQHLQLTYKNV
jgi:hypothetical protein